MLKLNQSKCDYDLDEFYHDIENAIYYLLHHNKNLTKTQIEKIELIAEFFNAIDIK